MSERPDLVDPLPEDEPLPGENIPDTPVGDDPLDPDTQNEVEDPRR
ncbi:hypothetical protein LMF20_000366 [Salmonella enterica]|uniref:Uncharacterized protein n=10 Tax=Salmonella enterica TaxID=28901 RepID=A0A708J501_SALTM|nr:MULTISPECIES: hypothetical protein [Salmonella]EAA1841243.1 hypothetical protein [Salmonella enterica subsp. enterica serovar Stanleyville]EAA5044183.1 hypothetical protein [Salmonella enterica subsp. enterica serovar London]EAY2302645.1 hypothetical protein [Salmonella enterica subsp. enterica serovar Typhimurium]EBC9760836.1 hypothetical protein [Salmonella enterica subsp. enterica serovar Tennessee]EBH8024415.1 hypothetical protein [Salmonella bongori]EBH8115460.1 hypothetical protein [